MVLFSFLGSSDGFMGLLDSMSTTVKKSSTSSHWNGILWVDLFAFGSS